MPKERRLNSPSFDRSRVSPYACSLKGTAFNDYESSLPLIGDERELKEARCPICMEHPHNAVLLLCSSQEKGCRPFMCDTSYRHSNCLDQYRKSFASSPTEGQQSDLVCPLCRGRITGWVVKEPVRRFMNLKTRCCSLETCKFSGNYAELRKHARLEHPSGRPSEANAARRSSWTTMERQLDIDDALAHQFDFESDWDGWPSWDDFGDADFWSDGTFFDFPMEEMSDLDGEEIGSLPLSDVTWYSSSLDMGPEETDSDFSRENDTLNSRSMPTNSSPSANNRSPPSWNSRLTLISPTSMYHVENDPTISRLSPTSNNEVRNPFSISRSTAGYDREVDPTNSGSRSSYQRENNTTYSRSISSYSMENAPGNSRTGTSRRPRGYTPRGRQTRPWDLPAFSGQWPL